ncbi:class I SAM-dependent DNA methyltransferase [Priestia filamentosa]|uniref:class I SAM-dependent DNA methyltransferase n=1 Tax=Priestia filamentosa TaxID=1402861 RepID=UPI0005894DD5|nr:class I SAM-dependent methyltransferase [Priestia filamentosa]
MSYERFASIYDELMSDAPYDNWVEYTKNEISKAGLQSPKILDLGCGTGSMLLQFAKHDLYAVGVDLSDEMLMMAKQKLEKHSIKPELFQQDMSELDLGQMFNCIVIYCDSLNYLQDEERVRQTFKQAYSHLEEGGLLLFDVHSIFKIDELFIGQTFAYDGIENAYIWNSFEGEYPHSVVHELTFFAWNENKQAYDRFEEEHYQRTFSISQYIQWGKEAGFTSMEVSSDFKNCPPSEESERLFFSFKK